MKQSLRWCAVAALIAGLTILGCDGSHKAWTTEDSWYRAADNERLIALRGCPLDKACFAPVLESSEPEAEKLLHEKAFSPIDAAKAKALLGKDLNAGKDGNLFLLRGVYLQKATGGFSVCAKGGQVLIHHGCLGGSAVPMKRRAVVAVLKEPPTDVYVMCSMAK